MDFIFLLTHPRMMIFFRFSMGKARLFSILARKWVAETLSNSAAERTKFKHFPIRLYSNTLNTKRIKQLRNQGVAV